MIRLGRPRSLLGSAGQAGAPGRVRAVSARPTVWAVMTAYTAAVIAIMSWRGAPHSVWELVMVAVLLTGTLTRLPAMVADLLPFFFVGAMFLALGPAGTTLGPYVHVQDPITLERFAFGGNVSVVWLQQHATWAQGAVPTALLCIEYLCHFIAPLLAAVVLWTHRRDSFERFAVAYMLVMAVGFLLYFTYPETPPWIASNQGLLPPVHRILVDMIQQLTGLGAAYDAADPEPLGAMPALHVSVPVVVAFGLIWGARHRRLAWLWVIYPVTVAFGAMYLGEHYLSDVVAGVLLGVACALTALGLEHRRGWRAAPPGEAHAIARPQPGRAA